MPERLEVPDEQHLFRYRFAAQFTRENDVVLDCACGTGYGKDILNGKWIGADKIGPLVVDLETWEPDFSYDVFVGLETIEHLHDYTAYVKAAQRARTVVLSTPIVPTRDVNPFHLQDFTKQDILSLFAGWELVAYEEQSATYGVFVFRRSLGRA